MERTMIYRNRNKEAIEELGFALRSFLQTASPEKIRESARHGVRLGSRILTYMGGCAFLNSYLKIEP